LDWRSALGGLGAALFGRLADLTSIVFVYNVCAYLPAIGLLTAFLPNLHEGRPKRLRSIDLVEASNKEGQRTETPFAKGERP